MEPATYEALNSACRTLDPAKLKTLGPFAMEIYKVLRIGNHSDKKRDDAIERGVTFSSTDLLGMMCRSFLLFRGAQVISSTI